MSHTTPVSPVSGSLWSLRWRRPIYAAKSSGTFRVSPVSACPAASGLQIGLQKRFAWIAALLACGKRVPGSLSVCPVLVGPSAGGQASPVVVGRAGCPSLRVALSGSCLAAWRWCRPEPVDGSAPGHPPQARHGKVATMGACIHNCLIKGLSSPLRVRHYV